jgi:hypothetical protein
MKCILNVLIVEMNLMALALVEKLRGKVSVEELTLSCCSLVIWKRTILLTGEIVRSMGWDLYHMSGQCVSCGKSKGHRLKTNQSEIPEARIIIPIDAEVEFN